jgi:hypothetical protein
LPGSESVDFCAFAKRTLGWNPLATELTAANRADNEIAPALIKALPAEVRFT